MTKPGHAARAASQSTRASACLVRVRVSVRVRVGVRVRVSVGVRVRVRVSARVMVRVRGPRRAAPA